MAHRFGILFLMLLTQVLFAQRGQTGDKTFADRYPDDVVNPIAKTYLLVKNTVDHDIIVCVRDQYKNYLNHVYIRNKDEYLFTGMPISRVYLQYKSKEFYFEDLERTPINYGDKHIFNFFFDPRQESNYYEITEEEFFKP